MAHSNVTQTVRPITFHFARCSLLDIWPMPQLWGDANSVGPFWIIFWHVSREKKFLCLRPQKTKWFFFKWTFVLYTPSSVICDHTGKKRMGWRIAANKMNRNLFITASKKFTCSSLFPADVSEAGCLTAATETCFAKRHRILTLGNIYYPPCSCQPVPILRRWTFQPTVQSNARRCCRPFHVCMRARSGHCARQVGQGKCIIDSVWGMQKQSEEPLWSLIDAVSPAISLRFAGVHTAPGGKSHKFLLDHFSPFIFFFPPSSFPLFYLGDTAQGAIVLLFVFLCHWETERGEESKRRRELLWFFG